MLHDDSIKGFIQLIQYAAYLQMNQKAQCAMWTSLNESLHTSLQQVSLAEIYLWLLQIAQYNAIKAIWHHRVFGNKQKGTLGSEI